MCRECLNSPSIEGVPGALNGRAAGHDALLYAFVHGRASESCARKPSRAGDHFILASAAGQMHHIYSYFNIFHHFFSGSRRRGISLQRTWRATTLKSETGQASQVENPTVQGWIKSCPMSQLRRLHPGLRLMMKPLGPKRSDVFFRFFGKNQAPGLTLCSFLLNCPRFLSGLGSGMCFRKHDETSLPGALRTD